MMHLRSKELDEERSVARVSCRPKTNPCLCECCRGGLRMANKVKLFKNWQCEGWSIGVQCNRRMREKFLKLVIKSWRVPCSRHAIDLPASPDLQIMHGRLHGSFLIRSWTWRRGLLKANSKIIDCHDRLYSSRLTYSTQAHDECVSLPSVETMDMTPSTMPSFAKNIPNIRAYGYFDNCRY